MLLYSLPLSAQTHPKLCYIRNIHPSFPIYLLKISQKISFPSSLFSTTASTYTFKPKPSLSTSIAAATVASKPLLLLLMAVAAVRLLLLLPLKAIVVVESCRNHYYLLPLLVDVAARPVPEQGRGQGWGWVELERWSSSRRELGLVERELSLGRRRVELGFGVGCGLN